ncbi:MAG: GIY-YIG nuclease family protein [Thermoguttaceae bacterium]|nr:GIY-YIG nuclease family protein [Thermoguttaceae bacterium]
MTDRENKIAIIKRDRLGLFKNLPERPNTLRSADGLNLAERRFEDINRFYEEYGREPSSESDDPSEIEVAGYLESFRGRPQDFPSLIRLDRHCLLQPKAADNSVAKPERIIARLLKMSPEEKEARKIFDLTGISSHRPIAAPDFVAQAKPCEEFARFEQLFRQCQDDLKQRRRSISPFKEEASIKEGRFFVVNGVLAYIDTVDEEEPRGDKRPRARIRCIFENGKEIYILRQSLAKSLYKTGQIVSPNNVETILQLTGLRKSFSNEKPCGEIYILRSESTNPIVRQFDDLFKIGFTTGRTEDRIKNAANEPTYLMAPVSVVERIPLGEIDVQGFETMLHHLFEEAQVSIDVCDQKAVRHTVREWFCIPLEIIYEGIEILLSSIRGEIDLLSCRYNRKTKTIVVKRRQQLSSQEEDTQEENE